MSLKVLQSSLIRQVKFMGACVGCPEVQDEVVKWIQACSISSPNSMEDLNVVLFDSHTDSIARKLIEKNVKSLFLLEGSQINADKQKVSVLNFWVRLESNGFLPLTFVNWNEVLGTVYKKHQ